MKEELLRITVTSKGILYAAVLRCLEHDNEAAFSANRPDSRTARAECGTANTQGSTSSHRKDPRCLSVRVIDRMLGRLSNEGETKQQQQQQR